MAETMREFNFGAGNPAPEVFPAEALGAAAQRVIARCGRELAHYPDPRGEPELRAIAVERMAKVHGLRPPIDDVVITNGSMQGLILSAQALAQRGDTVAVEEFCYGGTIRVFKRYGLELLGVALDDDGMRMDALAELLERQQAKGRLPAFIYTTASYQNPTGTTQPRARRLELLALARRYHLPVVEDDTYADISFEPLTEPAIYSLAEPGEVVYLSSFSKILGPGLRLGYFIAPEPLRSRLLEWKIDGGTSGLSQRIVAEYLGAELWPHVEEGRQRVKAKRNALLDALETETRRPAHALDAPRGRSVRLDRAAAGGRPCPAATARRRPPHHLRHRPGVRRRRRGRGLPAPRFRLDRRSGHRRRSARARAVHPRGDARHGGRPRQLTS